MQLSRSTHPRIARARRALRAAGISISAAGLLAAAAGPASAAGGSTTPGSGPTSTPGRVTASLTACHTAADLADRYATYAAQMVATAATQQMSLRLQLYQHTPGTPGYHLVAGVPGFGVWENSVAGIGVFNYSQEVTSLTAPASFRVQVGYRWLDAGHHVIKRATRTTVACVQPAQLANLVAGTLSITKVIGSGIAAYGITVRNDGGVGTGPFVVGITVAGVVLPEQTVASLEPGTHTVVEFTGPACAPGRDGPGRPRPDERDPGVDEDRRHPDRDLPVTAAPQTRRSSAASCPTPDRRLGDERPGRRCVAPGSRSRNRVATLCGPMNTAIHPTYAEAHVRCTCGNEFTTRSTKTDIQVEICSNCHPFYTGRQKLVDTGGRVERFQRRVAKSRQRAAASR